MRERRDDVHMPFEAGTIGLQNHGLRVNPSAQSSDKTWEVPMQCWLAAPGHYDLRDRSRHPAYPKQELVEHRNIQLRLRPFVPAPATTVIASRRRMNYQHGR
jgi:hypothetical protein